MPASLFTPASALLGHSGAVTHSWNCVPASLDADSVCVEGGDGGG